MHARFLAVVGALAMGAAIPVWPGSERVAVRVVPAAFAAESRPQAPAGRHLADPADSLYQLAREAFNREDFARAASLFRTLTERHPESEYRASALYFGAYAHYRLGGARDLRAALALLEEHAAAANGDVDGDADALRTRVTGALARLGDADAAERVMRSASAVAAGGSTNAGGGVSTNASAGGRGTNAGGMASTQPAACPRERDDERVAALNALLQMDADRALPLLQRVLARRDACSAALRRKAVFLVAQQGEGAGREELLLDLARNDPDAEVRSQAVFWLSSIDSPRAVDILEGLLRESSDDKVRDRALFALSQQQAPRARQVLRDYAARTDAPRQLRERAIFWIGQGGGQESADFLRGLYARLDDASLKERVLFSLSQTQGVGNERWLMTVARNANETPQLRGRAIFWLGQGELLATPELAALYDALDEREVKEQVIFALSQRQDRAAVDKLMDVARRESDRRLRERAIFWLGQSKDPRVVDFLLEIIDR